MSIDIDTEDLLQLGQEAAKAFPGRTPARGTLWRWYLHGVNVAGQTTKLETCVVGGIRYTSKQAISRFCAAQNSKPEKKSPTPSQRRTRASSAGKALEAAGI